MQHALFSLLDLILSSHNISVLNGCRKIQFFKQMFFCLAILKEITGIMVFCYQNCSDLLWEKIVLVIEKNFWNSRLKAKNLQNLWDHSNNLFKQWKVKTVFETILFSTYSKRFPRSNILEQLLIRIQIIRSRKHAGF